MRHHDNIVSYLLAAGLAAGCGVVLTAFLGIWNLHESEAARYSTIVGIEERLNAGLDTFGRAAVDVDDDGRQIFVFVLDLAAAESLFPPGVVPELGSWHLSGAMTSRLSDQPGLSDRYSPSAELPDDLIVTGEDMVAIRFVATGSIDWPPAHFGLAVGKVEIMHADILRVVAPAALIALGALAIATARACDLKGCWYAVVAGAAVGAGGFAILASRTTYLPFVHRRVVAGDLRCSPVGVLVASCVAVAAIRVARALLLSPFVRQVGGAAARTATVIALLGGLPIIVLAQLTGRDALALAGTLLFGSGLLGAAALPAEHGRHQRRRSSALAIIGSGIWLAITAVTWREAPSERQSEERPAAIQVFGDLSHEEGIQIEHTTGSVRLDIYNTPDDPLSELLVGSCSRLADELPRLTCEEVQQSGVVFPAMTLPTAENASYRVMRVASTAPPGAARIGTTFVSASPGRLESALRSAAVNIDDSGLDGVADSTPRLFLEPLTVWIGGVAQAAFYLVLIGASGLSVGGQASSPWLPRTYRAVGEVLVGTAIGVVSGVATVGLALLVYPKTSVSMPPFGNVIPVAATVVSCCVLMSLVMRHRPGREGEVEALLPTAG